MKQKTVRFYDDVQADISALQKLDKYKEYGFNSSREMIIAAVNSFTKVRDGNDIGGIGVEEFADLIATRLEKKCFVITAKSDEQEEKNDDECNSSNEVFYSKALSFMENL